MTLHSGMEHSRPVAASREGRPSIAAASLTRVMNPYCENGATTAGVRCDALFRSWARPPHPSSTRSAADTDSGSTFWSWAADG